MKRNGMVSLYVIQLANKSFFGGYDRETNTSISVDDPRLAKTFSNKSDIKLRPDEMVIELSVDLMSSNVTISQPFRPFNKPKK